jgi:cytochrome c-type biogenesis protein CcmF
MGALAVDTAAWCFLTVGIARQRLGVLRARLGRLVVLGSRRERVLHAVVGGYGAHRSLAVTEKRGTFRSWTVLLAIVAFSLSLIGTFLVRSGVLTSVHAFATDPKRGVFILLFLALAIGGSLALFAWRAPRVGLGAGFEVVSRESMLLANNVLLTVAMAAVLLGTLYPLFLDVLNLGKISVIPLFRFVFYPLMAPAVFSWPSVPSELEAHRRAGLVDASSLGAWRARSQRRSSYPSLESSALIAFGLWLGFWVVAATASHVIQRACKSPQAPWGRASRRNHPRGTEWCRAPGRGGLHLRRDAGEGLRGSTCEWRLEKVTLGGLSSRSRARRKCRAPTTPRCRANLRAARGGRDGGVMRPEALYQASGQTMTEADIDPGLFRDLYVSLGEPSRLARGVRVYHSVRRLDLGRLFADGVGRTTTISDRRYRHAGGVGRSRCRASAAHESAAFAIPLAVFVALAAFAVGLTRDRGNSSLFIGKPAPAFKLTQLADEKLPRARGRMARWLLNVWPRGASPAASNIRCWSRCRREPGAHRGLNYRTGATMGCNG